MFKILSPRQLYALCFRIISQVSPLAEGVTYSPSVHKNYEFSPQAPQGDVLAWDLVSPDLLLSKQAESYLFL